MVWEKEDQISLYDQNEKKRRYEHMCSEKEFLYTWLIEWTEFYFLPPLGWVCGAAVGARGGVNGRPLLRPPYWYFGFFSLGFKI